jgi:hypothetical protein
VLVGIGVKVEAAAATVEVGGRVEVAAGVLSAETLSVAGAVGKAGVAVGVGSGWRQPTVIKIKMVA